MWVFVTQHQGLFDIIYQIRDTLFYQTSKTPKIRCLFQVNDNLSWAALNTDLSWYFSCVLGFFGEPLTPGGNCSRCRCNNNSDVCNRTTGECIDCQHNTTGFYCERCENGTWGNATQQQCQGSLPANSYAVKRDIVNYPDLPFWEFSVRINMAAGTITFNALRIKTLKERIIDI